MEIVKAPDPILTTVCEPVSDPKSDEIKKLAGEMAITLVMNNGAGLAAPQVGHSIRMFLMRHGSVILVCINPEITRRGKDKVKDVEGCLSLPGKRVRVERSKICELIFYDVDGKLNQMKLRNFDARVAQHELDHLNGILIA